MIIDTYPAKNLADFTVNDRIAARRYSQGCSHARQGRFDLLKQCKHYDAGHSATLGDAAMRSSLTTVKCA